MGNLDELRAWFFRSLSSEDKLDQLEAEGVSVRAPTDARALQRVLPLEDFAQAIRRSAMRALPVYLAFFCFENSIRALVAERLSEAHGSDWWDECASTPIKSKVEGRRTKEGRDRWHTNRGDHEIFYTDFGDLSSLIQGQWSDFADLFPDQNWIIGRLAELEASRNIIAHSNALDEREVARLHLYLQDWVRQVGG